MEALFTRSSLLPASAAGDKASGGAVSRNEGRIGGEGDSPVDAADILAALARDARPVGRRRQDAVRCYLSASDGWREASTILGGAFAPDGEGLKAEKGE